MIDYTLTEDNLHLCDSYRVRRWKMRVVLKRMSRSSSKTCHI